MASKGRTIVIGVLSVVDLRQVGADGSGPFVFHPVEVVAEFDAFEAAGACMSEMEAIIEWIVSGGEVV